MATRYQLDKFEVISICRFLDETPRSSTGTMSYDAFKMLICNVFDVAPTEVNDDTVKRVYNTSGFSEKMDVDMFLTWYKAHMFVFAAELKASSRNAQSDQLLYSLAREHNVEVDVLDKVKREFDKFDKDGSGGIDKFEFFDMMKIIMKAKDDDDVNTERVKTFWNQSAKDGISMKFPEFVKWYLQLFHTGDRDVDGFSNTDMSKVFYSVQRRPVGSSLQRRRSL